MRPNFERENIMFKNGDLVIYPEGDIWVYEKRDGITCIKYIKGGNPRPHWHEDTFLFDTLKDAKLYKNIKSNKPGWF